MAIPKYRRGLYNNGNGTIPIPVIFGILAAVFIFVTAFSCSLFNRRHRQRQRRARALYQTTPSVLQKRVDQRLRRQYRSNGPLGWNAQKFPDQVEIEKYGDSRDNLEAAIGRPPPAYKP